MSGSRSFSITRLEADRTRRADDLVAEEEPLELQVNGASVAVTMRTPGHDEDLALGFLLTEGVIAGAADVASIRHCDVAPDPDADGNVIQVRLADGVALPLERLRRHSFASSSCGICGKATIEAALGKRRPVSAALTVSRTVLFGLPERLRAEQLAFAGTGGLHGVALFDATGALRVVREDVGRHNAVDKVVGAAVAAGWPLAELGLLVSGRVGFEIVQKAAAAGVSLVAGISAPSSLAVRYGDALGVTVVGFLRGHTANVYSHAVRIVA